MGTLISILVVAGVVYVVGKKRRDAAVPEISPSLLPATSPMEFPLVAGEPEDLIFDTSIVSDTPMPTKEVDWTQ